MNSKDIIDSILATVTATGIIGLVINVIKLKQWSIDHEKSSDRIHGEIKEHLTEIKESVKRRRR